ncbi:hypothetical protein [Streptomyces liliifuscus]|uniref:Uncharacterized protein n=1 Tax=Streptomyces liliifuscus TaxID=2797636 RepID=A0A7T7KY89_9ACTN|nr:hypothetical protein [Streptomyces liliifuscus]QQM42921.1 hypothetical protein JEQ17_28205 [Streptomyces liliifuscus]
MATAQLSAAPRPSAHPMANPGYGKKSAPDQEPRTGRDFVHLPAREASIAGYLDRLDDEADMSIKTLAKHLPYGQCAIGTALNNLSAAGHLRRVRRPVTVDGCPRWVWHTFFSRAARDDAWWSAFLAGEAPVTEPSRAVRSAAHGLLARLGRIDARLTLSAAECGVLEEQAAEWFARGAGEAQLVQAVIAGLPERVAHPYGFVRARLLGKLPPEPVETWAARYEVVCTACGEPGEGGEMRGGLCGGCWGARPGLAADQVRARAGQVRAALRTGRPTESTENGARA